MTAAGVVGSEPYQTIHPTMPLIITATAVILADGKTYAEGEDVSEVADRGQRRSLIETGAAVEQKAGKKSTKKKPAAKTGPDAGEVVADDRPVAALLTVKVDGETIDPKLVEYLVAGKVETVGDVVARLAAKTLTEIADIGDGRAKTIAAAAAALPPATPAA